MMMKREFHIISAWREKTNKSKTVSVAATTATTTKEEHGIVLLEGVGCSDTLRSNAKLTEVLFIHEGLRALGHPLSIGKRGEREGERKG